MRFIPLARCYLGLLLVCCCGGATFPRAHFPSSLVNSYSLPAVGNLQELTLDDGTAECAKGPSSGLPGNSKFGWANRLTPASYPATLRTITVGFNRNPSGGREVKRDALYDIVVFLDLQMNGPDDAQKPAASFTGRVRGSEPFMTFNLVVPLTLASGSFVVAVIDQAATANLPALVDIAGKSNPPGSESFVSFDGGAYGQPFTAQSNCCVPKMRTGKGRRPDKVAMGTVYIGTPFVDIFEVEELVSEVSFNGEGRGFVTSRVEVRKAKSVV
jgi:hypothetical protein